MNNVTLFAALADPMRRQLLSNLARTRPKTATELAKEYPITRPGIIKHLNVLEEAGLVTVHQQGRDKRYVFRPEPLSELEQWVKEITVEWEGNLHRLKTLLESENQDPD